MSETNGNGHSSPTITEEQRHNSQVARRKNSPKTAFSQAIEWQRILSDKSGNPDIKPIELASCARAWLELEECKRKLKMKPLPGSLRPTSAKPQRQRKEKAEFGPAPVQAQENTTPSEPKPGS